MKKRPLIFLGAGAGALVVLAIVGLLAYKALFSSPKGETPAPDGEEKAAKVEEGEAPAHGEAKKEGGEAGKEGASAVKANIGPVYPLEPFVVNLADPGRPRYLKLVIQAELDSQAAADELDAMKPKARDSVLMLLSAKTSEEVVSVGGKENLRNEMIRRLNSFLTQGKVVEVYFTEFVVQ